MPTVRCGGWGGTILGIVLLLACNAGRAAAPQTLRFEQFGVEHGLAQESATAILQDSQGFIWVGSQAGLSRYDGYRVLVFRNQPTNPDSLADNYVTALHEDSQGRLWVGTRGGGVQRYDSARMMFQRFATPRSEIRGTGQLQIRAIVGDFSRDHDAHSQHLWIATADGLQRLDTKTGTYKIWHHDPVRANSLVNDDVQALAWDRKGRLWVGTGAGLDRFELQGDAFEHFRMDSDAKPDLKQNAVLSLRTDKQGILWVGKSAGLEAWNLDQDRPRRRIFGGDEGLMSESMRSILQDRDGVIWIGTGSGLLRWDAVNGRFVRYRHDIRDPQSLADNDIDALFQDRSGTLWVGTHTNGTSRVDLGSGGFERLVNLTGERSTQDENKVYAIAGNGNGHVWLGTVGGGLLDLDPATRQATVFRHDPADKLSLPDNRVRTVYIDAKSQVWAGTGNGLARLDPKNRRFQIRHFADLDPTLNNIRQIRGSRSGNLWIGTDGGLISYDPSGDSMQMFRHDPDDSGSLSRGRVYALLEDRRGTLWVGTDSGLDRRDANSGRFVHYRHDPASTESLSHNRIHHLLEDRAGRVWVATAGGLNRVETDVNGGIYFRRHMQPAIHGADQIGSVLEDSAGKIWISNDSGLSSLDPVNGQFRNYNASDGLLVGSYYVGSGYAAKDGVFYFGGPSGLTAFRPEAIRNNSMPPSVVITELQVFNRPVLGDQRPEGVRFDGSIDTAPSLYLSHANSVFSLEFAALHYADPASNRYAYQLVGFDPDWIETDASRRFVTYTNLDPGDYTFRVKAANKDGVWNESGATLKIFVEPPYWATWWFRSLLVVVLVGGLWALFRYRVRGLTRQRALLEQEVRARTAEVVEQKEDIEQALDNLAVLGDIGREITATLDETAIFQTLDRHVHDLLDASTFSIYLLDEDGKGLTSALRMEGGQALPVFHIEMDDPTRNTARCARERRELHIELEPDAISPTHIPGTLRSLSMLFAPLAIGDRLLGVMTIQSPQQHAYGERERLVFRTLCAYGAIALDNAAAYRQLAETDAEVQRMMHEQQSWLEQEVGARTEEVLQQKADIEQANSTLSVLGEIGREITAMLVENEVCRTLDRHVHELLDATTFAIYLIDSDGQRMTSALRVEGGEILPVAQIELNSPTRHAAMCARERRELQFDMDPDKENPSQVPGTLRILSSLFAPLIIGDRLLGVMTIQSTRQHVYGERERLVFRTLSAYGAIALDNAAAYKRLAEADAEVQRVLREQQVWLEQEVSARTAEVVQQKEDIEQAHNTLSVLGEIGREITAVLDESAVFQTLGRHVHGLLDASSIGIYVLDTERNSLNSALLIENGIDLPEDHIDLSSPTRNAARCARERRELLIETAPDYVNPSHIPGTLNTLSALFAPLAIGDRLLGVMTIQSPRQHAYGERERLVFRTLCAYGAIALDNAAAYRRLAEADSTLQRMLIEQQVIFDNVAAAVFFIKDRVIHRCNRGMEEMLGYEPGELLGKPTEIYHPNRESWEALGELVYPLISTGKVSDGEWQIMRKNGEMIWISFRGRALDPQEPELGSIWVAHDITERKRTEAELERIRREQQIIFDNSPGGGILLTKDRIIVSCNPGLEALLRYEPGTLAGQPARINFSSDEAYDAFGRWAYPILAAGDTAKSEVEYRDKYGEPILAYVSGKAIDPNDLSQGVVWMATDMRQQKKDAAELDRARRELQIIFDNNIGSIAIIREGRIERCSRGFLAMYGYSADEAIGMSVDAFAVSKESSDALGQQTTPDLMLGKVVSGEFEYRRKDGSTGWLLYQGRALEPPELEKGTVWLCQDISKLKGQEAALLTSKAQIEQSLVEVEQLNRKVSLLGELTGFLQACPSAQEAFACIGDFGPRLFPESVGALYLVEENGDNWVEHGRWGCSELASSFPEQSFLASECWALRRSRSYRVDVPSAALCCQHVPERDGQRQPYTCLPLTAQGKTFGLLFIEHHQMQSGAEADRRHGLAVAMAEQIALAIANVQLREALLQQSIRDPLTGLYNRRYLQESLFREMAHSKRNHSTFAVLMIDVDHFKKFNDTYGHHAGDVVLQNVAHVIEARFRRSDVSCRFGGEEFTVLLPGTDLELAKRLANDVLEGIRDLVLTHENRPLERVTASLGVALFPENGSTPQALLDAADAALYQAKETGRNRVVVCGASAS